MAEVRASFSDAFEAWVDRSPDALAVVGDDGSRYSYGELEVAANRIANTVDELDPGRGLPTVAIALDQGTLAIVALVAAAKTGRTSVPIDPDNPAARVADLLEQLPPAVVLTTAGVAPALSAIPPERHRVLLVDELPETAAADRRIRPKDPAENALVIFTSGSTGRPKGVAYTYGQTRAQIRRDDIWVQPGNVYGVASEYQWLAGYSGIRSALSTGGTVAFYATRQRGPADLCRFLADTKVTIGGGVPSLMRSMLDADPHTQLPDMRMVALIGEAAPRDLAVELLARTGPECQMLTSYASSEAGGVASLRFTRDSIPEGDIIPAGVIAERVEVEIEDPDERGVGRIVVVTPTGSSGYVQDQGAGDVIEHLEQGRRRHRTGDLGRIRPDGMLEVHGRYAFLVKVRGQRVDAVEVEGALRQVPGVVDAVVGVHPDDASHRLTAWYVAEGEPPPNVATLRGHLRPLLPAYMVPAAYVRLEELPRGSRGKLDRAQLPLPDERRPDLGHPYEPPADPLEAAVADAFARHLGLEQVGRHDAFFDLGGDSLGAAEVMTMLSASLGRDLPLSVFVEASTPAELAERLRAPEAEERFVPLQPAGDLEPIYCLHGGGGQVLSFATLADRLGSHRPFIAVQMRQTDRARVLFRIGRLAQRYADEIAARQLGRPCVVGGHSYGGLLAQEVSRRLAAQGTPVTVCLLLDCGVPRFRFLAGQATRRRALGEDDTTTAVKEVLYALHALLGLRPKPHRVVTERMIAALWGMGRHQIKPTPAPLALFRATENPLPADPRAWERHTESTLDVIDVPGNHQSMLAPPHVDHLADAIDRHLLGAGSPLQPA
jgi:acyl-coenzyme A synthetase/AMP-(fatty) acid ligase/thioesterase domain-containing protein